jgi:hypothetical protein
VWLIVVVVVGLFWCLVALMLLPLLLGLNHSINRVLYQIIITSTVIYYIDFLVSGFFQSFIIGRSTRLWNFMPFSAVTHPLTLSPISVLAF